MSPISATALEEWTLKVPFLFFPFLSIDESIYIIILISNCYIVFIFEGYVMTHGRAEAGGHKLRTLTHEEDLPIVIKLSCGSIAGAVAQTGISKK